VELPTDVEPACRSLTPEPAVGRSTEIDALVLYDSTGDWGDLGILYAQMTANLLGHFVEVAVELKPVSAYRSGDLDAHDVTFYVGVVYDEPLNLAFREDFRTTSRRIVWIGQNLWQMERDPDQGFQERYGYEFLWIAQNEGEGADTTFFRTVHYKGEELVKWFHYDPALDEVENDPDIGVIRVLDPASVEVLAEIEHSGTGERIPYVTRSGNLTYVADNPLTFQHEGDRYLAFTDLMHDFVGIDHDPTQYALFRLEDVHPWVNPVALGQVIEVLDGRPWNMAVVPVFADPMGFYNDAQEWHFDMNSERAEPWLEQIQAARASGAEIVLHGLTHQFGRLPNPFNGVTGTDFEFWDAVKDKPIPGDSFDWAADRVDRGTAVLAEAGLSAWAFEVPHYQASMVDYFAINSRYPTVYHQGIYRDYDFELDGERYDLNDVLSGETRDLDLSHADYRGLGTRIQSQIYPYVIERDVYGQRLIPENMRNVTPTEMVEDQTETWTIDDMLRVAANNRVNRCGFASFFYHPFIMERPDMADGGPEPLRRLVEGVEDLGYTFVQACELEPKEGELMFALDGLPLRLGTPQLRNLADPPEGP
jgi:uncharacterized protein YdaL